MNKTFLLFTLAAALGLAGCDAVVDDGARPAPGATAETPQATNLAGTPVVIVTEDDVTRQAEGTPPTDNWVLYTRNAGTGEFVVGSAMPPLGVGSFETRTPTGADKVYLFNYDQIGTPLADVDGMDYATYRSSTSTGSAIQVPSINLEIDFNGAAAGGYAVLVFEPVYNTDQGAIVDDTWQTWDAYNGGSATWWSSRPINGVCAFNCFVAWDFIVANNPDAVVLGGFGVNQGSGNGGIFAATDALGISADGDGVTYDFEPYRVPTTKDECKQGGWQNVRRADGTTFKNQGDCIQYVNTGK